jgi:putative protease
MIHSTSLEVLAPASSIEHVEAAINAGADAIYIGIKGLSARPDNWSFSLTEAQEIVNLVHRSNCKIYFAVNAEIGEYNTKDVQELLGHSTCTSCDALILSDWGVIRLASDMNMGVPLHASTLLGVYNIPTIRVLEEMGVTRVIFNTNLLIHQMAELSRSVPSMSYEIISYGGLCFNDNRRCRLPHYISNGNYCVGCKDNYRYVNDQGETQTFSIGFADIDLTPIISQYVSIGVSSFKIEGRTRSAEYISHSTSILRKAVDNYLASEKKHISYYYI